jgi:raffinose/stachyose/melibiose transport system permease protein
MERLTLRSTRAAFVRRGRLDPGYVSLWISLVVVAILWLIPFIFIVFTSFKPQRELISGSPFRPPEVWQYENYERAAEQAKIGKYGLNSLLITFTKVPIGIFTAALAAFAFSRIRFRFRKLLFLIVIMGTMIPVQVALIPLFDLILKAGLLSTYLGILLPYIAFGLPYHIFLLTGFFNDIPRELDEAAKIDGASSFAIFWRIMLPLSLPALAALFILDFVSTWNEFSIALVLLQSSESWTIPLGLQAFQGRYGTNYQLMNAAIVMTIIPVLIVYVLFQRYFVSGLLVGSIKG